MAKATESTRKKSNRRLRATSSVPPDDAAPTVDSESALLNKSSFAQADDGGPRNEFIDDEAEEDNAEEENIVDNDEIIDRGEPTEVVDGDPVADAMLDTAVDVGEARFESAANGKNEDTNGNESDGEHSAHSLTLRAAAVDNAIDDNDALNADNPKESAVEKRKSGRAIDLYFATFKPNKSSASYQALLNDGCFEWSGISDYGYCNNVYKGVHLYEEGPLVTSSAWKPVSPTNFPDFQHTMEILYPAFSVMKTICNTLAFTASAGYVNLARVNPARFMFDDTNQTNAATLTRVSDASTPVFCVTLGLVRDAFIGPNGLKIEQAVRRGITLAPFECEAYRIFSCANHVANFEGEDHFTVPLYSNGAILFETKPIGPDGRKPNVAGWTSVQTQKRQKPEMISDRSSQGRRKVGVLAYTDEIPVIDARRKPIAWGTDTLAQITNDKNWPRFTDNLERDSVAVVVYTVNRWGHKGMRRLTFNINAVVLVADNIEAVSTKAADTIERETIAASGEKLTRLTRERPVAVAEDGVEESALKKRKAEDD